MNICDLIKTINFYNNRLAINMGKKVQLLNEDSILSKNFKYEKRKKEKILEKLKAKEEEVLQKKKMKEIHEVETKVDKDLELMIEEVSKIHQIRNHSTNHQKMFRQFSTTNPSILPKKSFKCETILISKSQLEEDSYEVHYAENIKSEFLVREKRDDDKKKMEEETKQEIRQLFNEEVEEEDIANEVEENEPFQLVKSVKKEEEIRIGELFFNVGLNFKQYQSRIKACANGDEQLATSESFIQSYFDHIFIENQQEQTIHPFRKIVITHAINHLHKCHQHQKSKGFTNGKILILTPFIGDAKALMDLIEESMSGYAVLNKEKLDEVEDQNDFFRVGIKINRKKTSLTYFSSFDHADILIGSPVGFKAIIGSQGDEKRETSFISSVEFVYIDRASVLLMQNWDHLTEVLKNLNVMPKYESLKNSIHLIRNSSLELKGNIFRQSVVFSEYNFPELNALKAGYLHNYQGCATSKITYANLEMNSKVERMFFKIELEQARDDLQIRFDYFKKKFWDKLHNKETMKKVVIFVSSYFEYVKLKGFLEKVNASVDYICEHTSKKKIQSRVARFNNDEFRLLVLTERAYYYDVCPLQRFHHIYFYSLPKNAFIFKQLVDNMLISEWEQNSVTCIYSKFEMMALERIVGTAKATQMVKEYCHNVSFIV